MLSGLLDFALIVGPDDTIEQVIWKDYGLQKRYQKKWKTGEAGAFGQLFPAAVQSGQKEVVLDGSPFLYERLPLNRERSVWIFSRKNKRETLLEQSLERMSEGIQIYDREGYLLFCNQNSRRVSDIPASMEIIGKHMLDIWTVDESKSAVLACLRTCSPVKNRVDTFASITAGDVTTINTAYPLFYGNELGGALLLERDKTVLQARRKEIQAIQTTLDEYTKHHAGTHLNGYTFEQIIGTSSNFQSAVALAKKFAVLDCNVLLVGETGTGKEMFAQSIHHSSLRKHKQFVAINCAAVPETLIESTLFGTTKGAFTGSENKAGLFEEADGGTLFLDELNSMSLTMQSKLLRVIQEGTFRRIGGSKDLRVDVRIISSCNAEPFSSLEQGTLRRDLFYRLSSVQIMIPPLRERIDDLPPLIDHYIMTKRQYFAKSILCVNPQVLEVFQNHGWPGNVRELYHVLDYAMNVMEEGEITLDCIPSYLTAKQKDTEAPLPQPERDIFHTKLEYLMGDYESQLLRQILEHYGNNVSQAARSLGVSRQTLSYRLRKYRIDV